MIESSAGRQAAGSWSKTSMAAPATLPASRAREQGVFVDQAAAGDVDDRARPA